MTDSADARFDRLREIVAEIDQARQRVKRLEDLRDEEIVRVIGDHPEHGLIVTTARVAGSHGRSMSRQHVDRIRRLARAKRASPDNS